MRKLEKKNKLCAICGVRNAVDMDHTPPKCIFPQPLPNDMITVPACSKCNGGNSKADEEFKAYISISVGTEHPKGKLLWDECLRTLRHNKKLYRKIVLSAKPAYLTTPIGIVTGKGHYVPWYLHEYHPAIKKIVQGLYYNQYKEFLTHQVDFHIDLLSGLPEENMKLMSRASIGGDQFVFWYYRLPENPDLSTWLLQFYKAHTIIVLTTPKQTSIK